ncbi:hypothetical protein KPMX200_71363 [Klebsiella pneumoniae]|nr:hypothetical protein KPMX200_71363 [Klebsiella pneumoniae]
MVRTAGGGTKYNSAGYIRLVINIHIHNA